MNDISAAMNSNQKPELKPKSPHAEREERIQQFWQDHDVFKRSIAKPAPKGDYTFYDGPPFATGLPHYGHIVPGTVKDVIPRWKTMQGYRVRRRWGWDCHGLPVENLIEKELDLKSKKDIMDFGVGKFNAAARDAVMRYADEWRRIVPRLGRWVDMEDDYRTMDCTYTETVWWIFSQLYDKGLIYEGFKSMLICPRCETTLSNFEVAQGYKDITDISLYVKFKIIGGKIQDSRSKTEQGETYLLAWTTTPWTLPGNVALAVNPEIEYLKVKITPESSETYSLILAKSRLAVLKDAAYEIVATFKGSDIVGTTYEPLFDYYSSDTTLKNRDNGWKVYSADFVETETGTGIVHIAPAFGADDYGLLTAHNLPFVQHVAFNGTFKKEVTDFAGLQVKPIDTDEYKDAHQSSDIAVIKNLAPRGAIFAKEKIIHSYPHCWRCSTPLLNYATSSWFVKVTDIKDKLVAENKKITWVPEEIGSARFGNWLEGARDWAISRSRFWGAPIPVWREQEQEAGSTRPRTGERQEASGAHKNSSVTGKIHVIGSIADLKKYSKAKNNYQVMRHGEAQSNVQGILSAIAEAPHSLTEKGKQQVTEAAAKLKGQKFDLVFISPFVRTRETTAILKSILEWTDEIIRVDERLSELNTGEWNGRKVEDFIKAFPSEVRFTQAPEKGETYADVKKRMGEFLYDMEQKYEGKNILIITHETPAFMLIAAAGGMNHEQALAFRGVYDFMKNAEIRALDFIPLPHNAEYELDLHRPFIDEVELITPEGNKLVRVPDVFDCWFESGSMPYGEAHYPFEKEAGMEEDGGGAHADFDPKGGLFHGSKGFPADFIAEGLDQTRGWFYSMLVLGVALFGKSPYKKVIVNGLVLAEDGQKMSKSKKNFPDLMIVVDNYGADSLRYYLLSSPVVRGQDLRFSEKGVDEVTKKLVNRLLNVVSFYEMYVDKKQVASSKLQSKSQTTNHKLQGSTKSQNPIDQWIEARLNETVAAVTLALEAGELDRATRPFMDFTDDISTWYLRRSRDRFKGADEADKNAALQTTKYALETIAKTMSPFMPFLAEDIWQRVTSSKEQVTSDKVQSVHLEVWPVAEKVDEILLTDMQAVRDIASKGLEARMNAKLNVRQPLASLRVKRESSLSPQLAALIKDEVNVKQVIFDPLLSADVELDTALTPELKEEGMCRELVRSVQDLRKEKGLNVGDVTVLKVATDEVGKKFIEKNKSQLMATCSLSAIDFVDEVSGVEVKIGEQVFKLDL